MTILDSQINPKSNEFAENAAHNQTLVELLRANLAQAAQGGGPKSMERHTSRGKLFVRERIDKLLDDGSPFLELSPLAAWELYGGDAPAAGIVTGIGRVSGRECLIV